MAKLKAVTNDINTIDAAQRPLYVEKDGLWILDVEPVGSWGLEDVGSLKDALGKERVRADSNEKIVKAWTAAVGEDAKPEGVKKKLTRAAELEALDPDKEAEKIAEAKLKAYKQTIQEKHDEELAAERQLRIEIENEFTGTLVDAEIATVLSRDETKGSVDLLGDAFKKRVRVIKDESRGGKRTAVVIDDAGNPRVKNAKGDLVTIADLAVELKGDPRYARAFDGTKASGSGATGTPAQRVAGSQPIVKPAPGANREGLSPIAMIQQGLQQRGS